MPEPVRISTRIGIVGLESSHVDQIVDHLNVDGGRPGVRVAALARAGVSDDRVADLAARGGIDIVLDSVSELLPYADVLIVAGRRGEEHREPASIFLAAGRPVFVDKPLAASVADADAIVAAARRTGALVASFSALRYAPAVRAFARRLPSIGPLRSLVVTGPVDASCPYGGRMFYGIHLADIAASLLDGEPSDVRSSAAGNSLIACAAVGDTALTLAMIGPADANGSSTPVPFQLAAAGPGGTMTTEVPVTGRYVVPGLDVFLDMVTDTRPAPSDDELLRPIRLLNSALEAHPGKPCGGETGR